MTEPGARQRPALKAASALGRELLELVYPENIYCLCCGDSMESSRVHGICDECASRIDWNVSDPFWRELEDYAFDGVLRCCVYGFWPRRIIAGFKLGGRPYAGEPIGRLLGERLSMSGLEPDIICAVPMHRKKLRQRGFNQSELLAESAAREYRRLGGKELEYVKDLLVKNEDTPSMRTLGGRERRELLHTTFSPSSQYADIIKGKKVILTDDVVTTGSTADACARVLKEAGAEKVYVLCFAGASSYISADERSEDHENQYHEEEPKSERIYSQLYREEDQQA